MAKFVRDKLQGIKLLAYLKILQLESKFLDLEAAYFK